jgi:hypothetical protein
MNATHEAIGPSTRASVPKHVLIQEIAGQSAILDLQADKYYGLDDVATDVWRAVTSGSTVAEGIDSVAALYEVEYERLQKDVLELLEKLRGLGLLSFE